MAEENYDQAVQKSIENATSNTDLGQDQVQEKMDEINEQGFFGGNPDPTPRENYTLQTPPDAPTPETDKDAAQAVVEATGDPSPLRRHQEEYLAGNEPTLETQPAPQKQSTSQAKSATSSQTKSGE